MIILHEKIHVFEDKYEYSMLKGIYFSLVVCFFTTDLLLLKIPYSAEDNELRREINQKNLNSPYPNLKNKHLKNEGINPGDSRIHNI